MVGSAESLTEADGPVRAMALVLRLERVPPGRTAVLEAAAAATLAVCTDPRAEPGGEWHEAVAAWVAGRIRKIARRARGAHWAAVQDLAGVTCSVGEAQVRALVPGPIDETPRAVSRLQIGGTDLDPDDPGPVPDGAVTIWLSPHVGMTVGKAAAQVGHAAMLWGAPGRFAVRTASPHRWAGLRGAVTAGRAVAVRDAGFTEVDPGTVTCIVAT